jgi:hypothetical protein
MVDNLVGLRLIDRERIHARSAMLRSVVTVKGETR